MAAETVIVARTGYRYPEKILIFVCGLDNRGECDEKNRVFLRLFPGSSRPMPVSVEIDQFVCLPEPLTPAKGFS